MCWSGCRGWEWEERFGYLGIVLRISFKTQEIIESKSNLNIKNKAEFTTIQFQKNEAKKYHFS
jgi:hypothetical protein